MELLLICSNDPRTQIGTPSDFFHACLMEVHRTMIATRHGQRKFPGIAGIGNEAFLPPVT
jgi:4-hydroxy-2-oxoheptanedioate aldolase